MAYGSLPLARVAALNSFQLNAGAGADVMVIFMAWTVYCGF